MDGQRRRVDARQPMEGFAGPRRQGKGGPVELGSATVAMDRRASRVMDGMGLVR